MMFVFHLLMAQFQTFRRRQKNDQIPKIFPSQRISFAACLIR